MKQFNRVITALVLFPLLMVILAKGSVMVLTVLVAFVSVLTMREYMAIALKGLTCGDRRQTIPTYLTVITYVISASLPVSAVTGSWQVVWAVFSINLLTVSLVVLSRFFAGPAVIDMVFRQVLGVVYIPLPLTLLVLIRGMDHGVLWIIWLLIIIFASDTGAFYVGSYFGKHPLAPNISPKKTIEGAAGGVAAAVILGSILNLVFFHDAVLLLKVIPCSALLAVAGQIGDLFESALKRTSDIKDSGKILPGHGGMLDRIDGLLFAIPAAWIFLVFVQ